MKVLVIGSKGFIGAHCVSYFSNKYDVWGADVIVDYTASNYILLDASSADYRDLFRDQSFDICINCSGAASVPDSIKHPDRDFLLNTHNVFMQLDAIRRYNPDCKFINMSSAAVYGNPIQLPIHEDSQLKPISPYGKHKLMAEQICKEFYENFNIKTLSLRVFSAYGEGLKKQLFWDLYQKYITTDGPIKLFGTGNESRDYIYIDDLISIIDLCINKCKFEGQAINAASGTEMKISDVVDMFYGLVPDSVQFEFSGETRKGDPSNWKADVNQIQKIGFTPKVAMIDGLNKFYQWCQEKGLD